MKEKQKQQNMIHLGTHGEDYGNWMSNPVLYTIGGLLVVTGAVASTHSFLSVHICSLLLITYTVRYRTIFLCRLKSRHSDNPQLPHTLPLSPTSIRFSYPH